MNRRLLLAMACAAIMALPMAGCTVNFTSSPSADSGGGDDHNENSDDGDDGNDSGNVEFE